MDTNEILAAVKTEITRLQKVVNLLEGGTTHHSSIARAVARTKRPPLSAAARKRIAAGQKARWAAFRANKKNA